MPQMLWVSLGATDRIEKQIYFVAIKLFFMPSAFKQTCMCREAGRRWGEERMDWRVGVILSHTTFLRQNGVACTRPKIRNQNKKRNQRMMARKDFVAFYFLSYRIWGREGEETGGMLFFFS